MQVFHTMVSTLVIALHDAGDAGTGGHVAFAGKGRGVFVLQRSHIGLHNLHKKPEPAIPTVF